MARCLLTVWVAVWLILAVGCSHFTLRTENRVTVDGPVESRVVTELAPVAKAGPVRPVIVEAGCGAGTVAVVDVDGLLLNTPFVGPSSLGENPVALFREKLDAAAADGSIAAIVLRVHSPGGSVAACQMMREELLRFKSRTQKPVVACLLDQATGGAYVVAAAADEVYAGPATLTGGFGVILNLYNLRDLMAQFNIIPQPILAGRHADLATGARALTDEESAMLKAIAEHLHGQIVAAIRQSRSGLVNAPDATFDGRIFTAEQALKDGLIDGIADLPRAIQRAAALGGITNLPATVVLYRRRNDPAHSVYAISANVPLQGSGLLPSVPGVDRSKLPTFLSVWQPELTLERLGGK